MDAIQSQLTSQVTGKLASLIGGNEKQTQSAIGAAVPGLLSALSGVASSGGKGADQLSNALGGFDTGMLGNLAGMLMKSSDKVQYHGSSLLSSLVSGTVTSGLTAAVSKFTSLNSGIVNSKRTSNRFWRFRECRPKWDRFSVAADKATILLVKVPSYQFVRFGYVAMSQFM